jgi:hypothetical protein
MTNDLTSSVREDIERLTLFTTTDLGLASSLLTIGFPIVSLDKSDPERCKFIFTKCSKLEKHADNYWYGNLKLNAKDLFNNQRSIKSRIYSKE